MKKLILLLPIFLFLIPSNTFAYQYSSSFLTNFYLDQAHNNIYSRTGNDHYFISSSSASATVSLTETMMFMADNSFIFSNYVGGYTQIPFHVNLPIVSNTTYSTVTDYTETCTKWRCSTYSQNGNCATYVCDTYNSYNDQSAINDKEYVTPVVYFSARWVNASFSTFLYCSIDDNTHSIICPINNETTYGGYLSIYHYVYYGSITHNYQVLVGRSINVYGVETGVQSAINNMDSHITDSTGNTNTENSNAISNFSNSLASNSTISSLIVMPITLYQKVLNSVNGSCSTFTLGNLLGTNVTFPCINPSNYLGSSLWSVIDIICSGILIFAISKRFIKIFNSFTSMDSTNDEVGE